MLTTTLQRNDKYQLVLAVKDLEDRGWECVAPISTHMVEFKDYGNRSYRKTRNNYAQNKRSTIKNYYMNSSFVHKVKMRKMESSDTMKIVKLSKPGCVPCEMVKNTLEEHGVEAEEINVMEHPEEAGSYGIMSVPVTILLSKGPNGYEEVMRTSGFKPLELEELISTYKCEK